MEFSQDLKDALHAVSQDVVPNLHRKDRGDSEIVAEVCIDMLETLGHRAAYKEFQELVASHGYDDVLVEAAKHVCTD